MSIESNKKQIINVFECETEYEVINEKEFIKQLQEDGLLSNEDDIIQENIEVYEIRCPYHWLKLDVIIAEDGDYEIIDDGLYLKIGAIDSYIIDYEEKELIRWYYGFIRYFIYRNNLLFRKI